MKSRIDFNLNAAYKWEFNEYPSLGVRGVIQTKQGVRNFGLPVLFMILFFEVNLIVYLEINPAVLCSTFWCVVWSYWLCFSITGCGQS